MNELSQEILTPMAIKTRTNPKANHNVAVTRGQRLFESDRTRFAVMMGMRGSTQGDRKVRRPAVKAPINERFMGRYFLSFLCSLFNKLLE